MKPHRAPRLRTFATRLVLAAFATFAAANAPSAASAPTAPANGARIPIRVVIVTTFEIGADEGDVPGEFQRWVKDLPLPRTLPFPVGYRHLRTNGAGNVIGVVTGEGAEHAATSIAALGLDPRFDLSHAYWIVAGIAGVDPAVGSLGSAAWAKYVVNGDLAFELDARDLPKGWDSGIVPPGRAVPYALPAPPSDSMSGISAFRLNASLADWAYRTTAHVALPDDANLRTLRAGYAAYPNALAPPHVFEGDDLAADRWWLGPHMNSWAETWTRYWTGGRARFAMTDEEDAGIMQALTSLAQDRRVDCDRVLILRTASDYTVPARAQTSAQLLEEDASHTGPSAYFEALGAAYSVGSAIVRELTTHWSTYATHSPR